MVVTTTKNDLNIFQHVSSTVVRAVAGRLRIQAVVPAFLSLDKRRKENWTNINCIWSWKTSSGHYYCQPFSLAEARQASAMKSWPKLIRVLLQISDFRVLFQKILICVWEEGWMMFFLRIQFYWSLRNAWTELVHSLGIFWKSGFSSTY